MMQGNLQMSMTGAEAQLQARGYQQQGEAATAEQEGALTAADAATSAQKGALIAAGMTDIDATRAVLAASKDQLAGDFSRRAAGSLSTAIGLSNNAQAMDQSNIDTATQSLTATRTNMANLVGFLSNGSGVGTTAGTGATTTASRLANLPPEFGIAPSLAQGQPSPYSMTALATGLGRPQPTTPGFGPGGSVIFYESAEPTGFNMTNAAAGIGKAL